MDNQLVNREIHIIMPVKDSLQTAEKAIRAIVDSGYSVCVYDDNSLPENAQRLDHLAAELGITVLHISEHVDTPSPNYRWVLQEARRHALAEQQDLLIVESDVIVRADTIDLLRAAKQPQVGMIAAVTVDESGEINYPYLYARGRVERNHRGQTIATRKRFSFCCTLLTREYLQAIDFALLDPTKNWYDVTLSHWSLEHGFTNLLMLGNPVLHLPHSSRPWKNLKHTNPLLYYWRKLTQHKDRI